MPYVPRPATTVKCAHCQKPFQSKHASRKYCSNPCNVQASYARNGRPGGPRTTRAELEEMLAQLKAVMGTKSAPVPAAKPPIKAQAAKPVTGPARVNGRFVKSATKTTKKVDPPAANKVTAPKPAKKAVPVVKKAVLPSVKAVTTPKPAKKATKKPVKEISSGRRLVL